MNCPTCQKPMLTPGFCWACGPSKVSDQGGALIVTAVPRLARAPLLELLCAVTDEPRAAVQTMTRTTPFTLASGSVAHLMAVDRLLSKLRVTTRQVAREPAGWGLHVHVDLWLPLKLVALAAVWGAARWLGLQGLGSATVVMGMVTLAFALEPRLRALDLSPSRTSARLSAMERDTVDELVRVRSTLDDAQLVGCLGAFVEEFARHSALVREERVLTGSAVPSEGEALIASVMTLALELEAISASQREAATIAPRLVADLANRKERALNQLDALTALLVAARAESLGLPREAALTKSLRALGRSFELARNALAEFQSP